MRAVNFVELDLTVTTSDGPLVTTLRFTEPTEEVEQEAIPSLKSVNISATVLAPGESMGQRESVSIALSDHQYPIGGTDYWLGTLWGKIKALYPVLRGSELRVIRGESGQELADMETRIYLVERVQSKAGDSVTVTAKDFLKQLDSDRAQAPVASSGRLSGGIDDNDTALTLTPSGVGNALYRTAGHACIGGSEIVEYTRSADTVTLTERGKFGTTAAEQEADSSFQEVLEFNTGTGYELDETAFTAAGLSVPAGQTFNGGLPAEIISYLMVVYAGISPDRIRLADWYLETPRTYTAMLPQPEAVKLLVDELIAQAGLVMWPDAAAGLIRLRSLLNVSGETVFDENRMLANTYSSEEQEDKHINESWVYWGRRNPLKRIDERENYRAVQVNVASVEYPDDFDATDPKAIRTSYARWINTQANAEFMGRLLIARYATPPRRISFAAYRADPGAPPLLGARCLLGHWSLQDATGAAIQLPAQIISLEPQWDSYKVLAEEITIRNVEGLTDRVVYISEDSFNVNLRELHDAQYATPVTGDSVTFIVPAGIIVGSLSASLPSVNVGDWEDDIALTLWIQSGGAILGKGGDGGDGAQNDFSSGESGGNGSTALYAREALSVKNEGLIMGGGGGGGGSGWAALSPGAPGSAGGGGGGGAPFGIGGAGAVAGAVTHGQNGTATSGGVGGQLGVTFGGDGGAGTDGGFPVNFEGTPGGGGAAGNAVDGESFVTYTTEGAIAGPRIN